MSFRYPATEAGIRQLQLDLFSPDIKDDPFVLASENPDIFEMVPYHAGWPYWFCFFAEVQAADLKLRLIKCRGQCIESKVT